MLNVFIIFFQGKRNKTKPIWHWIKKDLPVVEPPMNELIPKGPVLEANTPLDMFLCHFDMDLIKFRTLETNRQRLVLKRERVKSIAVSQMSAFIGICVYMFVVDMPQRRMYWSPATRRDPVAKIMTVNRFEEIFLCCMHQTVNWKKNKVKRDMTDFTK